MTGKGIRCLLTAAMALGCLAGAAGAAEALPAAAAAPVVQGLHKAYGFSEFDVQADKMAKAECGPGEKVVGGGGQIYGTGSDTLTLTRLEPRLHVNDDGTGPSGYVVQGAKTGSGEDGTGGWGLFAWAMCADADSLPGWHIRADYTDDLSAPAKEMTVGCNSPTTQRVIGTGAQIRTPDGYEGNVVLHMARASGTGDIARARSHVDADGFTGRHWLGVYAVCMNTPQGYSIDYGESPQQNSETLKHATVQCPGQQLLNAGAAISGGMPGHVSLTRVYPASNDAQADAEAVENSPTTVDWDYIVTQRICADKP